MAIYEAGIDVSRYQGTVNWAQVAAAGKQFAICRVGSSNNNGIYVDPYFLQNVNGAHDAGLKVGAYYYTYATTEERVRAELDSYLAALRGLRLEYPVFVDVEASSLTSLSTSALTGLVRYAMDILYQSGWYAGWYSYTNFINTYLNASALSAYPLWVADYRGYVGYRGSYTMWQYSSTGTVSGVSGNVDLDYSYKNFLPEIEAGGYNGYASSSPDMQPVSGKALQVFATRCEYFTSPDVNDVVGYLPLGQYPVMAQSAAPFNGFNWVTFVYQNEVFWTALLSDRNRLVDAEDDCGEQLALAQQKIEDAIDILQS